MSDIRPPRIYLSPPHMSGRELEFVKGVFESNWIAPLGPEVDAFEREFATLVGAKQALALSSGTAALHLALLLTGVGSGDEVLVSTLTFSASVNPILYQGGYPTFIDSDRTSWNMDPALLAKTIEKRAKAGRLPKAVILVHLYGQSADITPILAACNRYEIPLIEDAAEALGATYAPVGSRQGAVGSDRPEGSRQNSLGSWQRAEGSDQVTGTGLLPSAYCVVPIERRAPGTFGKAGVYSFNGNKIITTSGGGMLVSDDGDFIAHARKLATQAREPFPHYEHTEIGYNYRMSNILAAVGRGQLSVLAERVETRRKNFDYYRRTLGDLPGIAFMPEAPWGRSTRWLTCITIDPAVAGTGREAVRLALEAENIESRPIWKPMHLQPVFAKYEVVGGSVSEDIFEKGLCLPSGSQLTEEDLERIVGVVRATMRV
jgi:dTDP-4-amino-4,6-dideoxygalactose transaminase